MQRKLLFLACFFICATAATQQYSFVYYTPKDGLINSRVRHIVQDSRGRLFFLTYGGLSIYDGTRFLNYQAGNGLAHDLVNDVLEITPDSFLIATNTNKLNALVNGHITTVSTIGDAVPVINKFFRANDGKLYVSGDEGFYWLEGNRFRNLNLVMSKDTIKLIDRITEWNHLLFLIPWDNGPTVVYSKISGRPESSYSDIKIHNITANEGKLWVSTAKGIFQMDTSALKKGKILLKTPEPPCKLLLGKQTGNIMFSENKDCYVYGDNRILKISMGKPELVGAEQGLKIGAATHFFEDREGIFWIATDGSGVVKWKGTDMKVINTIDGKQSKVTAMANAGDTLWYYNYTTRKVHYMHPGGSGSFQLKEKDFYAQSIYHTGNKILLTDGLKLLVIQNKYSQPDYSKPHIIKNTGYVFGRGMTDRNGAFLFYTVFPGNRHLIAVMINNRLVFTHPVSHTVDQMIIDRHQKLWLITRSDHLMKFSIHPETPDTYLKPERDFSEPFQNAALRSLTIDSTGSIWLGTRNKGIIRVSFKGNEIDSLKEFTSREGLSDNFVYSLACSSNNIIWAGTQSGLDRIFLKNGDYVIGNTGRVNNWFQSTTYVTVTPGGTVWAQNSEGNILNISPSRKKSSSFRPGLRFTSFLVNNQENRMGSTFSHRQNSFSFSVASPSFIDERSIMYSYMLEGSHFEQWSRPTNQASFHFINLAPGAYTLRIKCEYPEQIYATEFLSHSFIISPPWWRTWQFRVSLIILLLTGTVLLVRLYYKRKMERQRSALERKQAIQKERTRIATDMHDDLGAGLSRIKFLSETIGIKKQQHQPIEEDIDKIREYSHQMIDKMGEIVWALNEKNDSLNDLLSYTRAYAMEYLSQHGIHCKVDMPENLQGLFVSGEFRRNVFLSVKEALHNVVKHAEAENVSITITTGRHLNICIKDDGRGFSQGHLKPFSNGLFNIEKRMKDIGGKSEIKHAGGIIVTLDAPLPS